MIDRRQQAHLHGMRGRILCEVRGVPWYEPQLLDIQLRSCIILTGLSRSRPPIAFPLRYPWDRDYGDVEVRFQDEPRDERAAAARGAAAQSPEPRGPSECC